MFAFVGSFSFLSHLAENHKHGMPGIGFSPNVSYILNRFDVLGVVLVALRMIYLYYWKRGISITLFLENPYLTSLLILAVACNLISEHDKYNQELKWRYIVCHSIWHTSIFWIANKFYIKL